MGRPSKAAEYLMQLQDSQRQQVALAMSLLEGRRGTTQEKFGRGVTKQEQRREERKLSMAQKELRASLAQANQQAALTGREIDEARSVATGYWVDKMGRPVLGKNGKQIKVPKEAKQATSGQATPAELRESALYRAQQIVNNNTDDRGNVRITRDRLRKILKSVFPSLSDQTLAGIIQGLIPKGQAAAAGGGFGGVK